MRLGLHERAAREGLVQREEIGRRRIRTSGRGAANWKAAPILAPIGLVPECKAAILQLVVAVVQKARGDAGLREHFVVHVLVVVATRRLLDYGAEQQVTRIAEAKCLSWNHARRDGGVHCAKEIGD